MFKNGVPVSYNEYEEIDRGNNRYRIDDKESILFDQYGFITDRNLYEDGKIETKIDYKWNKKDGVYQFDEVKVREVGDNRRYEEKLKAEIPVRGQVLYYKDDPSKGYVEWDGQQIEVENGS